MTIPEICGWLTVVFFNISYVPQIWKTWRTKKVGDISLGLWILLMCAYVTGVVYSVSIKARPIVVSHLVGAVSVIFYLCLYFKYRSKYNV